MTSPRASEVLKSQACLPSSGATPRSPSSLPWSHHNILFLGKRSASIESKAVRKVFQELEITFIHCNRESEINVPVLQARCLAGVPSYIRFMVKVPWEIYANCLMYTKSRYVKSGGTTVLSYKSLVPRSLFKHLRADLRQVSTCHHKAKTQFAYIARPDLSSDLPLQQVRKPVITSMTAILQNGLKQIAV